GGGGGWVGGGWGGEGGGGGGWSGGSGGMGVDSRGNPGAQEDSPLSGEIRGGAPATTGWLAVRRSHDPLFTSPTATGAPTVWVDPASGMQDIIYRDTRGRLIELWRVAAGGSGPRQPHAPAPRPAPPRKPPIRLRTPGPAADHTAS